MSRFKKNLKRIWDETTVPIGQEHPGTARRYTALSYGNGGLGWGVYDEKEKRYLKDNEIAALTKTQITETYVN